MSDIEKSLNKRRLQEFYEYFNMYYGAKFRPNQGLDELTDMICKFSVEGSWVDLGGGTSTFLWLPAFKRITKVLSIDKYKEAFIVQEENRFMLPRGCYLHSLERYNKVNDDLQSIEISFMQADLFSDFHACRRYDNVSQFGLLGLCGSADEYVYHLERMTQFMHCDSVFLGANWIFSGRYAESRGFSNSYLSTMLIEKYATITGKALLFVDDIEIVDDPNYTNVILYAFRHK